MTHPFEIEIKLELERSTKALKAAELLYNDALYADALSRSYYSILHAAKAVLLFENVRVESHEAVKRLFGLHLIKTGKIDTEYSIILREEQDDRMLADYDAAFNPGKNQVNQRIKDSRQFFARIEEYLETNKFTL